mgnify:FL=1
MNTLLVAKHLQYLRKSHQYTQDDLAEKCYLSRQAVSKWETGEAVPDLDVLLKLSKLYEMTINDILEPKMSSEKINDFEQLSTLSDNRLTEVLDQFDCETIAAACMGASPDIHALLGRLLPHLNLDEEIKRIGRVRVETVLDAQTQIIAMINLLAADREL